MTTTQTPAAAPTPDTPAPRTKTEFEKFRDYISTTDFIARVAPFFSGSETKAREFVGVVLNAVHRTPDLLLADRKSLLLSCMQAARERIMPDGKKGLLTVYNTKEKIGGRDVWIAKVEYQAMAAGMIQRLYDSGHVSYVDAAAVYEKDKFEFERGDTPRLYHKPTMETDPGPIVAAYMVAKLKESGEVKREVMPRRDIDRIHDASKAPNSSAWKSWLDQMAIKAVIKRGYKLLPSSPELDEMIEHDNKVTGFAEFGDDDTAGGATPTTAVDKLNAEISGATNGKSDAPAALEHAPGVTVPPMTIEGQAELIPAEGETKAPEVETKAAAPETKPDPRGKGPTFADVGKLIHLATKERKPAILDDAAELARGIENEQHRREANIQIADARKALDDAAKK